MADFTSLTKLARLYGIQPAYLDVDRAPQRASPNGLLRTLQALGVDIERFDQAADAIRERRLELAQTILEPVAVAWNGRVALSLQLPAPQISGIGRCELHTEQGARQAWSFDLDSLPRLAQRTLESETYVRLSLDVPAVLPIGYHRLVVELPHTHCETLIISAPERAYQRTAGMAHPLWGVFLPLYALHRKQSWGGGDFSDLAAMTEWIAGLGGSLVATLPMLSWLAEVSDDPSPYSPASRLFWNEIYLDVTRIPEFSSCTPARELVQSAPFQQELAALRAANTVDYPRQMTLKMRVLRLLAENFFASDSSRRDEFERYLQQRPELDSFAQFRAVGERQGAVWPLWPQRLQEGAMQPDDYDDRDRLRHAWVQWQVEQQLRQLAAEADRRGLLWYLDFPLGVNGAGYDVWRERDLFATQASGGAPPDAFFTKGQNWGFPPLHPERLRQQGYRYLIQALRQHLQFARLLRIDHVMGLHRFYWIPHGLEARDGAYVRYRTDELFAILVVESHRHQAQIVGENLGTVPVAVDEAMQRHGLLDMYVVQYEAKPEAEPVLRTPPRATVASLNTHDMPTFAAYWNGLDLDDRVSLDLMTTGEAAEERVRRETIKQKLVRLLQDAGSLSADQKSTDTASALESILNWLAAGPADIVLLSLEDLWQEPLPQNTPGTFLERCNWRRKSRYALEEIIQLPDVDRLLKTIAALRKQSRAAQSNLQPPTSNLQPPTSDL